MAGIKPSASRTVSNNTSPRQAGAEIRRANQNTESPKPALHPRSMAQRNQAKSSGQSPGGVTVFNAGIAIALAVITDCVMILLYLIWIGIVLNFIVSITFLFSFGLWLAIKKSLTLKGAGVLTFTIASSLVPFVLTTTISIMLAKMLAAKKLGSVAPGLGKLAGATLKK